MSGNGNTANAQPQQVMVSAQYITDLEAVEQAINRLGPANQYFGISPYTDRCQYQGCDASGTSPRHWPHKELCPVTRLRNALRNLRQYGGR
jgi:hypothetical protein